MEERTKVVCALFSKETTLSRILNSSQKNNRLMVLRVIPHPKAPTCTNPILGACSRKQRLHRNRSYFLIRPRRLPQARLHRSESRSTPIAINLPATRTGTKFTRMSVIKTGHASTHAVSPTGSLQLINSNLPQIETKKIPYVLPKQPFHSARSVIGSPFPSRIDHCTLPA